MPLAGHATRLKITGAAVAVVAEPTTNLGGNIFQITNAARRIFNPTPVAVPVVKDAAVAVPTTNYTLDLLFGRVLFSVAPAGAVTLDFEYLPVATLAEVKSFSFAVENGLEDRTSFDSAGVRTKLGTLLDTSGSLEMLSQLMDDIDPVTGGVQTLRTVLQSGAPKLLEVLLGSTYLRWWVMLENIEVGAEVAGLVSSTANLKGAAQAIATTAHTAVYAFGS